MSHASAQSRRMIRACVLQAPVSDREGAHAERPDETAAMLALARAMPDKEELLPRRADACGVPMTAARYLSLYGARADGDDYFSSDLTDAELAARLGHMAGTPTLVAFSLADEYVPAHVDKERLVARLVGACGGGASGGGGGSAEALCIAGADHACSNPEAAAAFVEGAVEFVRRVAP